MLVESTSKLGDGEANCGVRTMVSGGWSRSRHSGWRGCDVLEGPGLTVAEHLLVTGSGGDMDLVGEFSGGDTWLWLQALIPIVTLERQVHY